MAKKKEEPVKETGQKSASDVLKSFKRMSQKISEKHTKAIIDVKEASLINKISFDSPQLTYLFNGFSYDRVHQLQGPESSGKSSIATYIAGQLQKKLPLIHKGKQIVIYIDFERTFDPEFAQNLGLNLDEDYFMILRPDDMESSFEMVDDLIRTEAVACIIFDSDASAPTKSQNESEYGKASFGRRAAVLSDSLARLNILASNYKTAWIHISQERASMNSYGADFSATGGYAIKFFASTRNRITKSETLLEDGKEVGIKIRVRNYKNKAGQPWKDAELNLYFNGGFNSELEYVDFLKEFNLITVAGSFFSSEEFGFKVHGKAKLIEWLKENPETYEILKKRVDDILMKRGEEEEVEMMTADSPQEEFDVIPDLTEGFSLDNEEDKGE